MDNANYVAPTGRGTFVAVVNGSQVGEFNNQADAEQAFNANRPGAAPGQAGMGPTGGAAAGTLGQAAPQAGVPAGSYMTRVGPRTIAEIRAGIIAAGGTVSGNDDVDVATFNRAGGGSNPSVGPADRQLSGATGGTSSGMAPLIDAAAYGNTETLKAQVDDAIRRYALGRTAEERNQAYLDLQRWQTELGNVQNKQKTVTDMATAVMSAATSLGSRPADYVKFNQVTSGGRDIFDQISGTGGPTAAYGGPTGQVQPGSVWDLLGKLGISYPQTPETPAGVLPGATNPQNPQLPAVPVPGAAGAPGAGGTLPAHETMVEGLRTAGWGGDYNDRAAVAAAWWNADPVRRGTPMPGAGPAAGAPPAAGGFPDFETMKKGLQEAGWGGNYDDRGAVAKTWWEADPARRAKPMPAWS